MTQYFNNPENALRRAHELIAVDSPKDALKALSGVLTSKRHRQNWSPVLEDIATKYVDLCVQLGSVKSTKDCLLAYRVCAQGRPESLAAVIRHLLQTARKRAAKAADESAAEAANRAPAADSLDALSAMLGGDDGDEDVDDDDEDKEEFSSAVYETLLLNAVSGDSAAKRIDKEILAPWLKFEWESYRVAMDMVRNMPQLQELYHEAARQAFQFCLTYSRRSECKRLCDNLRHHLLSHQNNAAAAAKEAAAAAAARAAGNEPRPVRDRVILEHPTTLELYMQTRFEQLRVTAALEQWQDAQRAVEDVALLMRLAREPPSPSILAGYYMLLANVFGSSGAGLFHAYSLAKWRSLNQQAGTESIKTQQRAASRVLLAALAVPATGSLTAAGAGSLGNEGADDEATGDLRDASLDLLLGGDAGKHGRDKRLRIAGLVGFPVGASRQALLAELDAQNVMSLVRPELRAIREALERTQTTPFDFSSAFREAVSHVAEVEAALGVEEGALAHYMPQLIANGRVRLLQMLSSLYDAVSFDSLAKMAGEDFAEIEPFAVEVARTRLVPLIVDHRARMVRFGGVDVESRALRHQLRDFARALSKCSRAAVDTTPAASSKALSSLFNNLAKGLAAEQTLMHRRQTHVEEKKAADAQKRADAEEAARKEAEAVAAAAAEAERERLEAEAAKRRQRAAEREAREAARLAAKASAPASVVGADIVPEDGQEEEFQSAAAAATAEAERQQAIVDEKRKALAEAAKRHEKLIKNLDYLERARRREELPLLIKDARERHRADVEYAAAMAEKAVGAAKAAHAAALAEKKRLESIRPIAERYREELVANRKATFEARKAERDAEIRRLVEEKRAALLQQKAEAEEAAAAEREAEARRAAEAEEQAAREAEARALAKDARAASDRNAAQQGGQAGAYKPPSARQGGSGAYRPPGARGGAAAGAAPPSGGAYVPRGGAAAPPSTATAPPAGTAPPKFQTKPGGWRERMKAKEAAGQK